jgi:hypothetical protein
MLTRASNQELARRCRVRDPAGVDGFSLLKSKRRQWTYEDPVRPQEIRSSLARRDHLLTNEIELRDVESGRVEDGRSEGD